MERNYVEDIRMRAERALNDARDALEAYDYPTCICRAQESFELFIKAILITFKETYPRKHDVSEVLIKISDKLPNWLREKLGRIKIASKLLTNWKDPAKYGDEKLGLSSQRIFKDLEAKLALQYAEEISSDCLRVLIEFKEG